MKLILLNGLGREQLHWQPFIKAIQHKLPEAKIEKLDLPGAGILYKANSPIQIGGYINFLQSQIEEQFEEPTEPAVLIGLSLGGMLAMHWAKLYPQKFEQLILINTSSRLNHFYQRLKLFYLLCYPKVFLGRSIKSKQTAVFELTCNTRPVPNKVIENWTSIQQQHPVAPANQLRQLIAASLFKPPTKAQLPKVHILYSAADRLVSSKCSEKLIDFLDASFDKHLWAGHDLSQDAPIWVAEKIIQQIKKREAI